MWVMNFQVLSQHISSSVLMLHCSIIGDSVLLGCDTASLGHILLRPGSSKIYFFICSRKLPYHRYYIIKLTVQLVRGILPLVVEWDSTGAIRETLIPSSAG
jgi:hypothetical protein